MNSIHIMSNSKEIPNLSIYGNLSAETSKAWDAPKPPLSTFRTTTLQHGSTPKYLMKSKAKKTARITAWRQRLQSSDHNTWQWLRRYKASSMLTYTTTTDGIITAGDDLINQIHTYWENIWPSNQQNTHLLQQLANIAPWPEVPAPNIPAITADNIRKNARRLHSKASGPDSWTAQEISFAPQQALEFAAEILNSIEDGAPWPTALTHWRQLHIYKPGKPEGYISSTRPISIGSIWYRIWASHRIRSLQQWILTAMPPQQHGCLKKKGTHTALIPTLAAVEASLADPQAEKISYVGATDLSKAFDKMAWKYSIEALSRMGMPQKIIGPLKNAWHNQKRWMATANHIGKNPYSTNSLPQGDPASPLGLMAPLSEAFRRILVEFPPQNSWASAPRTLHGRSNLVLSKTKHRRCNSNLMAPRNITPPAGGKQLKSGLQLLWCKKACPTSTGRN